MSTKTHKSGHGNGDAPFHDTVTFEPRDIHVATVVKQLFCLGVTIVISLLICVPILRVLTNVAEESDTPMSSFLALKCQAERAQKALPLDPSLEGVPV